jgi:hypothetical protein
MKERPDVHVEIDSNGALDLVEELADPGASAREAARSRAPGTWAFSSTHRTTARSGIPREKWKTASRNALKSHGADSTGGKAYCVDNASKCTSLLGHYYKRNIF